MAIVILTAMALILLVGPLIGFIISRILARPFGWKGTKLKVVTLGFVTLGGVIGVLAVVATFYESSWAPPPHITFNVPSDFSQSWVIVLEDPAASQQLDWQGLDLPFVGKSTIVSVASHGIVRVKNLGILGGRMDIGVKWSDGVSSVSQAGGPAPKSTGATSFSAFNRVTQSGTPIAGPPFGETVALGKYILAREGTGY